MLAKYFGWQKCWISILASCCGSHILSACKINFFNTFSDPCV